MLNSSELEDAQREMRERQQRSSQRYSPVLDLTSEEIETKREHMKALRKRVTKKVGGARKSLESAKPALEFLISVIKGENLITDKFKAAELLLDYSIADHRNLIDAKHATQQVIASERDAAKASAKADRARMLASKMSNREILQRARFAMKQGKEENGHNGTEGQEQN